MKTLVLILTLLDGSEVGRIVFDYNLYDHECIDMQESVSGYMNPNAPIIVEAICTDEVKFEGKVLTQN